MNTDKKRFHYQLEKEAQASGVSIGQSIGIDIPPPRPRRKPSNPYPRKSSSAPSTWATSYAGTKDGRSLSSASSSHCKRVVNLEIKPLHERPMRKEVSKNTENQDGNSSDVFTLRREDHSSSVSSANNNAIPSQVALGNPGMYREFVPSVKGVITQHATNESHVTMKRKENPHMHTMYAKRIAEDNGTSEALESGNTNSAFHKKFFQGEKAGHQNCAFNHKLEDFEYFPAVPLHFQVLLYLLCYKILLFMLRLVLLRSAATAW